MIESIYKTEAYTVFGKYMRDHGHNKNTLARILNVSNGRLQKYINNPLLMSLQELITLGGVFGIPVEELVYLLTRNKGTFRRNEVGKWYLQGIRERNKDKEL